MEKEKLVESLLNMIPVIHKKLISSLGVCGTTRQQFELLHFLSHQEGKSMSFYGEKMGISKPNLTVVADRLIDEGFMERDYSKEDRRVIILRLTQKGKDYVAEQKQIFKAEIAKRLKTLQADDIIQLENSISNIIDILDKLK